MKKTCTGCRALDDNRFSSSCNLGFKNKSIKKKCIMGEYYECIPLEECPKPKTYDKYFELKERC